VRVLFDARPARSPTGIGRYTRTLASLLRTGLGEHVCWSLGGTNADLDLAAQSAIEEELELPALLAREAIDAFHSPLFHLPAVCPSRAVVTIHDAIPAVRPDLATADFARLFEGATEAAARADVVVCPSEHARRDIIRTLGVPAQKIRVVPEAPALCFRALSPAERAVGRERLVLPPRYLLVVGALERRKNPLALLDALGAVAGAHVDFHALYAGPPGGIDVAAEAGRRGLADRVHVLGPVSDEDLVLLYNEAVALVFPSLYEGFGLPVVEAFACATPVIASSAASIPEVTGDAALLFEGEDAEALAKAILRVGEDDVLRADLRRRGAERLRLFAPEAVRGRFAEIYTELEAVMA
jgi:glycosyltransferase involved in cell wall biosynthesis